MKNSDRKIWLVDLDEVVFDFDAEVINNWETHLPGVKRIDSNELQHWNLTDNYPAEFTEAITGIWRQEGFFRSLKPIKNAVEALKEIMGEGHAVFLCSTPTTREPYCVYEKLQSIYEHFGERLINNMIMTKDKTLIQGDYLIDDKPEIQGEIKFPTWTHVHFDRGRTWGKTFNGPQLSDWSKWRDIMN